MDFPELTTPATLLPVSIHSLCSGLDRLSIRNLRLLGFDFQLIATNQSFLDDHEMKFTHSGNDQFLGLTITVQSEGRILFDNFIQGTRKLGFIATALGSDCQSYHGRWKLDGWQGSLAQN